jgi:hypothetical protein
MIVEWNTHIFSPDTVAYPLHEKAAYKPDMSQHLYMPQRRSAHIWTSSGQPGISRFFRKEENTRCASGF